MKKYLRWCFIPALLLFLISVLSCHPAAVEVITTPSEQPPSAAVSTPFYGVGPELDAELKLIVLADETIQELIKDKTHTYVVDGQTVTDTDYYIAVGVYLRQHITGEEFGGWLDNGRQDSPLIEEYVGVLNIGYNEKYSFKIDKTGGKVTDFIRTDSGESVIPEMSAEEKSLALKIALADSTVKELLEGKKYIIAPEGQIGLWHDGDTKLGVSFQIEFAQPYEVDIVLPRYGAEPARCTGPIDAVTIAVLLDEGRVATIVPRAPLD